MTNKKRYPRRTRRSTKENYDTDLARSYEVFLKMSRAQLRVLALQVMKEGNELRKMCQELEHRNGALEVEKDAFEVSFHHAWLALSRQIFGTVDLSDEQGREISKLLIAEQLIIKAEGVG